MSKNGIVFAFYAFSYFVGPPASYSIVCLPQSASFLYIRVDLFWPEEQIEPDTRFIQTKGEINPS